VTCPFSAWLCWLFARIGQILVCMIPRSLTSRLASRKKSCVTTSIAAAEDPSTFFSTRTVHHFRQIKANPIDV